MFFRACAQANATARPAASQADSEQAVTSQIKGGNVSDKAVTAFAGINQASANLLKDRVTLEGPVEAGPGRWRVDYTMRYGARQVRLTDHIKVKGGLIRKIKRVRS